MEDGVVCFSRDWPENRKPEIYWGEDRIRIDGLSLNDAAEFGLHSGYFRRGQEIVFVIREDLLEQTRVKETGLYLAGDFNGWEEAVGDSQWELKKGQLLGEAVYKLKLPREKLPQDSKAAFKFVTGAEEWIEVPGDAPNVRLEAHGIRNFVFNPDRTGYHIFKFTAPVTLTEGSGARLYFRLGEAEESVEIRPGVFLKTLTTESWLGVRAEDEQTEFRLFAPRAHSVELYLFESLEESEPSPINLFYDPSLVWRASVPGDYQGWYYYYKIAGEESDNSSSFDETFPVVDPYALAVVGPLGPGIVLREEKFVLHRPTPFQPPAWHNLVVAEAHLRDLTARAPIDVDETARRGFTGLREWVEHEAFYLKQLGVNAVELQPVHEFDTQDPEEYAWGYMPVNFFSPASQYSRRPEFSSHVEEFQKVVESFHQRGIAVILDVVYNHVGNPNYLQFIDKEYYFLLNHEGNHENFSGCGNTIDATPPMARRLIRDSLIHWIEAYGVDGFRFDLGELIGKETLGWLESELKQIKPGVILIAEPWSFRGHIARELRETGFASWNDEYRESVRQYIRGETDATHMAYFLQGSHPEWTRFPAQTVNYVASHDDRCWIDKITENPEFDGTIPTANDRRRTHLMIAILMMSAGIPMVSSGDDMLKSKGGVNNTYLDGERNAIPYARAAQYSGTVEYFRAWVAFRQSVPGRLVRLDGIPGKGYFLSKAEGAGFIQLLNADGCLGNEQLLFAVNTSMESISLGLADVSPQDFSLIADTERFSIAGLPLPHFEIQEERVVLPALSCALFLR